MGCMPFIGPPLTRAVPTDRPGEDPYEWNFERLESWRAPGNALRRSKPNVALPPKESLTQADLSVRLLLYQFAALNPTSPSQHI
jgi:hypothetical protein